MHNQEALFAAALQIQEPLYVKQVEFLKEELKCHYCNPSQITDISAEMSPAFHKGVEQTFPWATLTYDKFYVMNLVDEAVDRVRREEQKQVPELKSTRYLLSFSGINSTFISLKEKKQRALYLNSKYFTLSNKFKYCIFSDLPNANQSQCFQVYLG